MKVVIVLILLLGLSNSFSQSQKDSILMLNGKVYKGTIIGLEETLDDSILKYKSISKKGHETNEVLSTYRIFSYTQNGENKVLYHPDEFKGNFLSIEETKHVTIGSYDARQTFKPRFVFWSSYAIGLGASVFDTYLSKKSATDSSLIAPLEPGFFKSNPSIAPFFVPAVLSVSWSFPTFKLKDKQMLHKEYKNNANYYRGYHRISKQKRILSSLMGSVAGIATGMTLYYILQ
jgi:hypothetical protein